MSRPETQGIVYGTEHEGPVHEGGLSANGRRFAIVAARFNDFIVEQLIDGALDAAARARAPATRTSSCSAARAPWRSRGWRAGWPTAGAFDGIVCLGAVIRGATPHFDLVVERGGARASARWRPRASRRRVRRARLRHHRAGDRARRHQGRQPGLRRGDGRRRDGRPVRAHRRGEKAEARAGQRRAGAARPICRDASSEPRKQEVETSMAGPRRRSREIALQILHQIDAGGVARVGRRRRRDVARYFEHLAMKGGPRDEEDDDDGPDELAAKIDRPLVAGAGPRRHPALGRARRAR